MVNLDPWYEARELMTEALEKDLLGPEEGEVLDEAPLSRFAVGILYPQSGTATEKTRDRLDAVTVVDDVDPLGSTDVEVAGDATFDPAVALSHVRFPSSMGLTFAVSEEAGPTVTADITADRYMPLAPAEDNKTTQW